MSEQEQLEEKLCEMFHTMWDGFPEGVQLCHKSHRIVAVNPACAAYGRVPGTNCAKGCAGFKAGLCRHVQMQKTNAATWCHGKSIGAAKEMTTYWLPVVGYPDYYIHFSVGLTIDYEARTTEEQA